MNEKQIIVIANNQIKANINGRDFEMSLDEFKTLSILVDSAVLSNIGAAYMDEKGDMHILNKKKYND